MGFFAANGFRKAPRHIIERPTDGYDGLDTLDDDDEEVDLSAAATLSRDRVETASMNRDDFEELVRLDRKIMGQDRRRYMRRKFDEAMLDSGIRVSLTARIDGVVAGFVMARIDFGDFGRNMPTAVIDTIAVSPDFRRLM